MKRLTKFALALVLGTVAAASAQPAQRPLDTTNTLASHLSRQLISRTNGSCAFTGNVGRGAGFVGTPYLVANFWLADVTNIMAGSIGQLQPGYILANASYGTAVSPRFCLGGHNGGVGGTNVWLLRNGTFFTNWPANAAAEIQINSGQFITLMARTNPVYVKYLPDIKSRVPWLRNNSVATNLAPVVVRFHLTGIFHLTNHTSFISVFKGGGSYGGATPWTPVFGDYSFGDLSLAGDSDGPVFAVINNEAALCGLIHYAGGGELVSDNAAAINAAMAALCASNSIPVEQLTPVDLSAFPVFQ